MPGKVIRAQLVARVFSVLDQIATPFFKKREFLLCEPVISVRLSGRRQHEQHVGALFQRHLFIGIVEIRGRRVEIIRRQRVSVLLMLRTVSGRILLSVEDRVASRVMRCEIKGPRRHFRRPEHRPAHGTDQFRHIQEE